MLGERRRVKGLFAIDTVNGDTWTAAQAYCGESQADIVCVQETRVAKGELTDTEASMRALG